MPECLCPTARETQQWEARAPQLERRPRLPQLETSPHSNEDPAQSVNKYINKNLKKQNQQKNFTVCWVFRKGLLNLENDVTYKNLWYLWCKTWIFNSIIIFNVGKLRTSHFWGKKKKSTWNKADQSSEKIPTQGPKGDHHYIEVEIQMKKYLFISYSD